MCVSRAGQYGRCTWAGKWCTFVWTVCLLGTGQWVYLGLTGLAVGVPGAGQRCTWTDSGFSWGSGDEHSVFLGWKVGLHERWVYLWMVGMYTWG